MNYSSTILPLILVALAAGGCATTHETVKLEARTVLAAAPEVLPTTASSAGQASMAWGDRWTATNLFERAVEGRPDARNHFNLASAYERTGRLREAAASYQVVTEIGQYQWAYSPRDYEDRDRPVRRFNLADEAAVRLARLQRPIAYASFAGGGAISAAEAGVQASATVGAASGGISDARAIELDAAAEARRR